MSQNAKYTIYAVAGLVVVGLAWYFFGALGSTIAAMLGLGAAQKQLRSYVAAEAEAEAAKDRARAEHQRAQADIEAEHTKEIKRIAKQHKAKVAEARARVDAAQSAEQLDGVIDDAVEDLERVIGRPIDTINKEGFVVAGLIHWLLLLGVLFALCCRVGYASPERAPAESVIDRLTAKHKRQVKRLLRAIEAAKTTILTERANHKKQIAELHNNYRRELQVWRADLKECQTKKQILAKPQPTWPRDVGFAVAGFGGAALLCGVGLGAAALAGRVRFAP